MKLSTLNSQISTLDRFARVRGSGPFNISVFCATTGLPHTEAVDLLWHEEKVSGRVLCMAPGFYLLKPRTAPVKAKYYNWCFNQDIQRRIFDACASWQFKSALYAVAGLKTTALDRYLRAMVRSGNLITKQSGFLKIYLAHRWRPLTTYSAELPPLKSNLSAS